jgi:DNA-binding NarL/FixJ family response regulator
MGGLPGRDQEAYRPSRALCLDRRYDWLQEMADLKGSKSVLILFVEVHCCFRQAASYLMDRESDLSVVSQAGTVAEGRQEMAQGGIDTALVDIPLPDEGAEEMVRELHEANPPIPILVMTHLRDPEVRSRFLEAGASEVLSKEISFAEVLAAVRRLGSDGGG